MHGARKKIRKTGRKTKTIPLRQLSGFNRRLIWRKCGQILRPRGILPRDWRAGRLLHDRRPRHDRRHDARHRHMEGPRRLQHGGIPPRSCRSSTSTASPGKRSCTDSAQIQDGFPNGGPSLFILNLFRARAQPGTTWHTLCDETENEDTPESLGTDLHGGDHRRPHPRRLRHFQKVNGPPRAGTGGLEGTLQKKDWRPFIPFRR